MTTGFESLAEEAKDSGIDSGGEGSIPHDQSNKDSSSGHETTGPQFESLAAKVRGIDASGNKEAKSSEKVVKEKQPYSRQRGGDGGKSAGQTYAVGKFELSGEEEKRPKQEYQSRSEEGGEEKKETEMKGKEEGIVGGNKEQLSLEEITRLRERAQQNSAEVLTAAQERYEKAKEKATQGLGATTDFAKEKTSQAKDRGLEGAKKPSQYVTEKGREVKDTAAEKGQQGYEATKDTVVGAGQCATGYTEKAKEYTLGKAAAAKDATVESGKGAVHYAEQVGEDVREKTAVAGWAAAHYTTEKTVEGTKADARAVRGAAEYATYKAAEIVGEPLGAVKKAAAATGESMKEYTARKKEEAESELQARKAAENQGEERSFQGGDYKEESQVHATGGEAEKEEAESTPTESFVPGGGEQQKGQWQQQEGGGVLGAIGETIVEIARKTKELVIGQDQTGPLGNQKDYTKQGEQEKGQ